MRSNILKTLFFSFLLITSFINCSSKEAGGTIETTNGAVAGTVIDTLFYTQGLTVVNLIPSDFDPTSDNKTLIISDTANDEGVFEFKNISPNIYNIEIISIENNLKAFYRDIEIDGNDEKLEPIKLNFTGSLLLSEIPDSFSSNGEYYIEGSSYKWNKKDISNQDSIIINDLPAGIIPPLKFKHNSNNSLLLTSDIEIVAKDTTKIKAFSFFKNYTSYNSPLTSNKISALSYDKMGFVWIGTADNGFITFSNIIWQVSNVGSNTQLPSNTITTIESIVNSNGDTISWIGTAEGLLERNGPSSENLYTSTNSLLPSNNIRSITHNNLNGIWVGTASGLAQFDGNNIWDTITPPLSSNDIKHCKMDSYNNLWVANNSGIAKYDGSNWFFISSKPVVSIAKIESLNELWLAHEDGSISVSKDGYGLNQTITSGYWAQVIFEAFDGTIYIGTSEGIQIFRNNSFSALNPGAFIKLKGYSIKSILEDGNKNLWFGTENNGLIVIGPSASEISFPQ